MPNAAQSAGQTQRSPGVLRVPPSRHNDSDNCLSEQLLLSYASGQCSIGEVSEVEKHLDKCTDCQQLLNCWLQAEQPSQCLESETVGAGELTTFAEGFVVNERYKIQRFVGRGGMGEVYEAQDQLTSSRVALKTLLSSRGNNPRAVRRFRQEVRNALRVGHRHVCRINELQEHRFGDAAESTVLFFTMEFVEGRRLAQHLQERLLSIDEVRVVARQLLDGLDAAHEQNILHLDFKSDNVMLREGTETPFAVVMDFGLSRALDSRRSAHSTSRLQVAGTLPYMSVEQLECRPSLQPTADIYSFGVVLYEMLTGQLPFQAPSLSAMLLQQLRDRPKPPSVHRPALSPGVDRFVMRCLASSSRRRFADAAQARQALEQVRHWSRPTRALRPWWLAGVCVSGVALSAFWGQSPPVQVEKAILPLSSLEPVDGEVSQVFEERQGTVAEPPPPASPSEGQPRPLLRVPIIPLAPQLAVAPAAKEGVAGTPLGSKPHSFPLKPAVPRAGGHTSLPRPTKSLSLRSSTRNKPKRRLYQPYELGRRQMGTQAESESAESLEPPDKPDVRL